MKKIHTRVKKRHGLSTHLNHYKFFKPGTKKNRPKTFKTEEDANGWALKQGLKLEQYYLKKVKKNKKFQIVNKIEQSEILLNEKNFPNGKFNSIV